MKERGGMRMPPTLEKQAAFRCRLHLNCRRHLDAATSVLAGGILTPLSEISRFAIRVGGGIDCHLGVTNFYWWFRWNVRRTNATNPGGNLVLYRGRSWTTGELSMSKACYSISGRPKWEDYAIPPRITSPVGRRHEYVITGTFGHTPPHYMLPKHLHRPSPPWYIILEVIPRRHCWVVSGNVVEPANHRAALYPSSTHPHWLEIGQDCRSVLHRLPLLEGAIVGEDEVTRPVSLLAWSSQPVERAPPGGVAKASAHSTTATSC
ncbi:hypothetical protein H6P81_013924 [Aristolochia fimbriata]|uniref:Uncharacterized protein n=1 Tax=Aristolochia fimbriata TaxID=158543 RepID=A0AAV7EJD4_ARIFI|nr:hypothetical protein H6P81_013924 [Aristolochia fimbriata]